MYPVRMVKVTKMTAMEGAQGAMGMPEVTVMPKLKLESRVTLNNGVKMPVLGLGTFEMGSAWQTRESVLEAIRMGYRLIDTARMYGNEEPVGEAVRQSGVSREELFVTSKLWSDDHGHDRAIKAVDRSLKALGLDYLDLFLIHWPTGGKRVETWKALVKLQKEGKCRAIGVANYMIGHLVETLSGSDVVPAVDQVECNPFIFHDELLDFCRSRGVQVEAYRPLAKATMMNQPVLKVVSSKHRKTPAQVLIRWSLQRGLVPIPKSVHRVRLAENIDVFDFELPAQDMKLLDSLNRDMHLTADPEGIP